MITKIRWWIYCKLHPLDLGPPLSKLDLELEEIRYQKREVV